MERPEQTSTAPAEDNRPQNQHQLRSEATRARILDAAHRQFVANGLEGTRMEVIATEAGVNKSLVYRHFGNREQLYREVLMLAYTRVRDAEAALELPDDPVAALDRMVSFTLDYYLENPDFLILVGIENLKHGEHLRQIRHEGLHVSSLLDIIRRITCAGIEQKLFRETLDPVDFYMVISSQCWFTVATQHTFGITFGVDVLDPDNLAKRRALICDNVRRFALRDPAAHPATAR
ncbi:TetR/AcrR family transcriptional regulator [Paracoccus laeviglucosivorans]|nr:TetR/AcrR family transcriptional regulator [Paracoccus laeviglucosivorans]